MVCIRGSCGLIVQGEVTKVVVEERECPGFLSQLRSYLVRIWRMRGSSDRDLVKVGKEMSKN